MNVPQMRMDKAAFLDWAETREERCELVGGRVVMMMRPVMGHGQIMMSLIKALLTRIDATQWQLLADFAVEIDTSTVRAPDLVLIPIGSDRKSRSTSSPVFIAEVLSPSTATVDMGDKVSEYLALPSLIAYLVLSQDEAKAWLWLRGEDRFPPGPQVIAGAEATIAISPLGLNLPMAEIYAGAI
jgi:Uma2 family endonuclease